MEQVKNIYCLRTRFEDSEPWGEVEYFRTKKERDESERICRILGGIRTHSFSEKKTADEVRELFD